MQLADGYYPADLATGTPSSSLPSSPGAASRSSRPEAGPARRLVQFVEDLDIRMPTPGEAATLNIPPGVPVARVLRTAYDASGTVIEVLDSILPADRYLFRYVIDVP